jgi:cytochrome c2
MVVLSACSDLSAMAPPTLSPQAVQGRAVFESYCQRCHETTAEIVVVGPSLAGVASRAGGRIVGMDAEAYIRNSIEEPGAYTVEGFAEGLMPATLKDELTAEKLDAVVAYLLTLE